MTTDQPTKRRLCSMKFEASAATRRLRIIRQENRGLSDARNTGIIHARAGLIGFLDGDDIWLPEKAARHVAAMRDDPTIGISFSHSEYLSEGGRRTGSYSWPAAPGHRWRR